MGDIRVLFGVIAIIFGSITLLFYKNIIKFQGESKKKSDWPENVRKRKMIIGGISLIILGILLLIKYL